MPISLGIAGAELAFDVGTKLYNNYESGKNKDAAQVKLDALNNTPLPQETADPSLLRYYAMNLNGVNNPQGISAGEKAQFNQNVANNVNTQNYNATNTSGGNLSRYIHNALQPSIINSSNQLVTQDQGVKRANYNASMGRLGGAVNQLQGISNTNARNAWQRRMMIEQALGGAINSNNAYQMNTLNNLGSDIGGAALKYGSGSTGKFGSFGGASSDTGGYDGAPDILGTNYSLSNRVKLGGSY